MGHSVDSSSDSTTAEATAMAGTRHAFHAVTNPAERPPSSSNRRVRMSQMPSTTPTTTVITAMMMTTGMCACTVV